MPEPLLPLKPGVEPMVIMGRVAAAHGVRGWIKVQPYTESLDRLLDYDTWWLGKESGAWREVRVESAEVHHKTLAVLLADCPDRNAAESLRGLLIAVPRSSLPEQRDGEYYWTDLIGLSVVNGLDKHLGVVEKLLETGANDVLCVKNDGGELLIPFVEQVIQQVDIKGKTIRVDWSTGYAG
ncbi:MAG: ribosome maturation factor RimM [Pseudomonadota bacterium]